MTFKKGVSGNPSGLSKTQRRTLRKMYAAIDLAIDGLGKRARCDGATRMAELITDAMEGDIIGTLNKLGPYMPKSVNIDVQVQKDAASLSDNELLEIIQARQLRAEKDVEGELIEQDPGENNG